MGGHWHITSTKWEAEYIAGQGGNLMWPGRGEHWQITHQPWTRYVNHFTDHFLVRKLSASAAFVGRGKVSIGTVLDRIIKKIFLEGKYQNISILSLVSIRTDLKTLSLTTAAPPSRALSSSDRFKFTSQPQTILIVR